MLVAACTAFAKLYNAGHEEEEYEEEEGDFFRFGDRAARRFSNRYLTWRDRRVSALAEEEVLLPALALPPRRPCCSSLLGIRPVPCAVSALLNLMSADCAR